ncbi:MAG: DNA mismatch repair endonuclease MutL [bacterium]
MGKIKLLPEEVFSKIAAGEVIEKPSNALKELIENSLDAKATIINVRIIGNGLKLIEVRDNGSGIYKDDLPLVIQRYATSKIENEKDLLNIQTFGFRGEALFAISRISLLQIISKPLDQPQAYMLISNEGNIEKIEETNFSYPSGTDIKVLNLFFNTPVRKKFLSAEKNELSNLINTFKYFALINNETMFTLHIDDQLKYNLIPSTLQARIKQLLGSKEIVIETTEIDKYKVTLALCPEYKYDQKVYSQNNFFVYVNKRIVFMNDIDKVIVGSFKEVLGERGKIEGVICIDCPPNEVDSNIHPRKTEIRFLKPLLVKNLLQKAIKNFINNNLISKPLIDFEDSQKTKTETTKTESWYKTINLIAQKVEEKLQSLSSPSITTNTTQVESKLELKLEPKTESKIEKNIPSLNQAKTLESQPKVLQEKVFNKTTQTTEIPPNPVLLYYWNNCYFLIHYDNSFYIVDQHNASERVIYSRLLESYFSGRGLISQNLLIPLKIEISGFDKEKIDTFIELLNKIGFRCELQGKFLVITSHPVIIKGDLTEGVRYLFEKFEDSIIDSEDAVKEYLATFACKTAIKKGDKLSEPEILSLFNDLLSVTNVNPYFCPHGRNVMIKLTFEDIDKMFERG